MIRISFFHTYIARISLLGILLCNTLSIRTTEVSQNVQDSQNSYDYVIISDFGQVAAIRSDFAIFKEILRRSGYNFMHAFAHMGTLINKKRLKSLYYDVLNRIGHRGDIPVCDETGEPIPAGFYELLCGTMTCEEVIAEAQQHIEQLKDMGLFKNDFETDMIQALIETTCSRDGLTAAYTLNKRFMKLLKRCAQTNENENKRIACMILSNFNDAQFQTMKQTDEFEPLFASIPDEFIFVSGDYKDDSGLKPNPDLYTSIISYCTQELGIPIEHILYLDDQWENCAAMQQALQDAGVDMHTSTSNVFWITNPKHSMNNMMTELTARHILL